MKTLDKYVVRNFLFTAVLCLLVLFLLRIVSDLFLNIDEFLEEDQTFLQRIAHIGSYYGYNCFAYFIELGGVIIVSSAVFSLARMNHTNELTAMLASGVSLHRVTLPIVICAMVMGALVVTDQELLIPRLASKLARARDSVSDSRVFQLNLPSDGNRTVWRAGRFDSGSKEMTDVLAIPRDGGYVGLLVISGRTATEYELGGEQGWLISEAVTSQLIGQRRKVWAHMPSYRRVWSTVGPRDLLEHARQAYQKATGKLVSLERIRGSEVRGMADAAYDLQIDAERFTPQQVPSPDGKAAWAGKLEKPVFSLLGPDRQVMGRFLAESADWAVDEHGQGRWELVGGALFVPSDLTAEGLVLWKSGRGLDYMSTSAITRGIELGQIRDVRTARLIKHGRFTAPISNLVMLLLGLPFILSRERNVKASATLCLLTVGAFFAFVHICRQMDMNPLLAAWLPLFLFGPVSIIMLDAVKT